VRPERRLQPGLGEEVAHSLVQNVDSVEPVGAVGVCDIQGVAGRGVRTDVSPSRARGDP